MKPAQVKNLVKQSKSIQGWFSSEAAMMFAWVDEIQKQNNIQGDTFEIGCHHGKSALLLASVLDTQKEKLAVCDLFGMQGDNVSRSGNGDLAIFNENLRPLKESGVKIDIFQKNSAELTVAEIGDSYRLFHVDGGHNPDEALIDLNLAAQCTVSHGVILLDDPFRTEWPGVTEALIRFLDQNSDFQAIVVGFNKLLLTRSHCSAMYLDVFETAAQRKIYGFGYPWRVKQMPFHKSSLNVFYVPDYLQKKSVGNLARSVYNKSEWIKKGKRTEKVGSVKVTSPTS